jgi:hypothetical protein
MDAFLTIVFRVGLLPYLRLAIACMKRNTFIEHKEAILVCEENRLVSMSYNILLTTSKGNARDKFVILTTTIKSTLTCTDYGKTGHSVETCHNRKREVPFVPITIVKSTEPIARIKT